MPTPSIHQFVAGYANFDAISNEVRTLRAIFRSWGAPTSHVFAEKRRIHPEFHAEIKDVRDDISLIRPDDIVLLHLSIGCAANQVFRELNCKKAILYHNITPPDFFRGFSEQTATQLADGRRDAASLASVASVVMADSQFNADELAAWGYPPATVLPLVLDFDNFSQNASRSTVRTFSDGLTNILFVGRCAPNKRIEDLVAAFYYYQHYINPSSRFIHAGSYADADQYRVLLLTRIKALKLENFLSVGSVPQAELNAYYKTAHVFLCLSEHEGFCVPLVEAMIFGLPIFAKPAAAVPETLGGAGILLPDAAPRSVAETVRRTLSDELALARLKKGRAERLAAFSLENVARRLATDMIKIMDLAGKERQA